MTHVSPGRKGSLPSSTGWGVCNLGWQTSSSASTALPLVEYFQNYSLSWVNKNNRFSLSFLPVLRNSEPKVSKLQMMQSMQRITSILSALLTHLHDTLCWVLWLMLNGFSETSACFSISICVCVCTHTHACMLHVSSHFPL